MAEGRYVYLRSFDSNRQLRIDGINIFASPTSAGGSTTTSAQLTADDYSRKDYSDYEQSRRCPSTRGRASGRCAT